MTASAQRIERTDPTLAGCSVLVIEDHPDSRDLLVQILRSLRAHVYATQTIDEAERILSVHRVHLVVSDMRLPDGTGLDLRTTNGGVRLRIPEGYSARLETGTVNGGIDIDFPVTVQGRLGREFTTTLGGGGPLVRAETTNGQVRISRERGDLTRLP